MHQRGKVAFAGECWQGELQRCWKARPVVSLDSVKVYLLCPRFSRAGNIACILVHGGEGVRGLELGAPLDCLSRHNVSFFCRHGPG